MFLLFSIEFIRVSLLHCCHSFCRSFNVYMWLSKRSCAESIRSFTSSLILSMWFFRISESLSLALSITFMVIFSDTLNSAYTFFVFFGVYVIRTLTYKHYSIVDNRNSNIRSNRNNCNRSSISRKKIIGRQRQKHKYEIPTLLFGVKT